MKDTNLQTGTIDNDVTVLSGDTTGKKVFVPNVMPLMSGEEQEDTTKRVENAQGKSEGESPLISSGTVNFVLKGQMYKAIKSISESSGEAQIVLVERNGKRYCLKIYYPNFRFKDDILNAVWNVNMDMVVKLYDYGHTTVNGIERDYELMEYLEGGTLAQYRLDGDMLKFRIIALQAAASLAAIHSYGIIHKDIKPGNFFFRDQSRNQVVLGDFGISSMMKDDEEMLRTSQARTPAFAAPEMYDDVIDGEVEINQKVDFYSLGITLLYLWLGKSPFSKNERLMMRLKQEGHLPHLDELPERVAQIVKGLTSINPQRRWGYEEVERWFVGEDVPVDTSSAYLRYKTFMIDPEKNLVAHDVKELVPLLYENQQLGIRYLYSNRLSAWFDECGNNKMAVLLNDIVEHRYPTSQQAGLMAALYAMEPDFPYYDLNGQPCKNAHEIAFTLLQNAREYKYKLQDPQDILFVYLDSHFNVSLSRLQSYFAPGDDKSVIKLAYEVDNTIPFLTTAKSDSIEEIVAAFGSPERTEDEWNSLSDGRLLAWLAGKAETSMCEAVRLLSERGKANRKTCGCQILYNIDRNSAFDLKDADTPNKVALLMAERLLQCQDLADEQFAAEMQDYLTLGGRLEIYAKIHQWSDVVDDMHAILDMSSPNNTERYGMYDIRTAAYKLCKALGVQPAYHFEGEDYQTLIHSLEELRELPIKDVRSAIRSGHLVSWISTFYHEDPLRNFDGESSYNNCLREFLLYIGSYDGSEMHYKRFVFAQEQVERKLSDSKMAWDQSMKNKNGFRIAFMLVNIVWIVLLAWLGIEHTHNMVHHVYAYTMLVVGIPMGVLFVVRNYFRGNGFSLGLLQLIGGVLLSLVPAAILAVCLRNYPGSEKYVVLAMSVGYLFYGMKYAFGKGSVGSITDEMKGVFKLNEDDVLNELLYYTFRMRTFKFKGSSFSLMDDAVGEAKSNSTEKVINCVMWSLIPACLTVAMVWFHSHLLDHNGPNIDAWKQAWADFWTQFLGMFN